MQQPGAALVSRLSYDLPFYLRPSHTVGDALLVEITGSTVQQLGADANGNLVRSNHTTFLRRLATVRPKLVLFDIAFITNNPVDAELALEFKKLADAVVIGSVWTNDRLWPAGSAGVHQALLPVEAFVTNHIRWGYIKLDAPSRGVVRRLLLASSESTNDATIAWEAAKLVRPELPRMVSVTEPMWVNYYGKGERPFQKVSYEDVCRGDPSTLAQLTGKLLFVGYRLDRGADLFKHPSGGALAGLVVQATQTLNLIQTEWLREMPEWAERLVILLTAVLAPLAVNLLPLGRARLYAAGAALGLVVGSVLLQWWGGVWWNWIIPVGLQVPVLLLATLFNRLDVFISYKVGDGETNARALQQALFNAGKSAYLAPGSIAGGDYFPRELLRAIERAKALLLVLTPDAFKSLESSESWVSREVRHALKMRRRIVVLRVGVPQLSREAMPAEFGDLADRHSIAFQTGEYFAPMMAQVIGALKAR
jgi:CHASE2 domain-containing sensor protein